MLPLKYLRRIEHVAWEPSSRYPGVWAIPDPRRRGYRYLASYDDGRRHKRLLLDEAVLDGPSRSYADWEWHHVVEGRHFADIDFGRQLGVLYAETLPCVLIHRDVHDSYTYTLARKETNKLFRDPLPRDRDARSDAAAQSFADLAEHQRLRRRVYWLEECYRSLYDGDWVLQRIAQNVFDDVKTRLGGASPVTP